MIRFIMNIEKRFQYILLIIFIFSGKQSLFSQNHVVSGVISNKQTGERIIGALICESGNTNCTLSNSFGFYSISCMHQTCTLNISYVGHINEAKILNTANDTTLNIKLTSNNELDEIIVQASSNRRDNTNQISLRLKELRKIPSMTGEPDLLKAFQMMPGVQFGNEGNNSLFVRGGSPDQNLIMLDDVPLYYINHLGGFLSVFDDYCLNSAKLYKGGFPARYSGRLSSIMDVRMKEGDLNNTHGQISLGLLSAKISVEGPLKKEKCSYIFSLRRSFFDLFSRPFSKFQSGGNQVYYYTLYDLSGKIRFNISESDRLLFSLYNGRDKLLVETDYTTNDISDNDVHNKSQWKNMWGNQIAALRWNHTFSHRMFCNSTLSYSRFNFLNNYNYHRKIQEYDNQDIEIANNFYSEITDFTAKTSLDYYYNTTNFFRFGIMSVYHIFTPTNTDVFKHVNNKDVSDTSIVINHHMPEYSVYFEDEFKIGQSLSGNAGIHAKLIRTGNKKRLSLQPRINVNYKLTGNVDLNASYSKMLQEVHLLSNSGTGYPTDLWMPSTQSIPPASADHYCLGVNSNFQNWYFSIESYFKNLNGLIDFREGTSVFANSSWESEIEKNGHGNVYGIELLSGLDIKKTSVQCSYSYSKNIRKFSNINKGRWFPDNYDRSHSLKINFSHKFNSKIDISFNWIFLSGRPVTLGVAVRPALSNSGFLDTWGVQETGNNFWEVQVYDKKNNFRLPAYHRADFAINFRKKKKRGIRCLSFNVYNLYNQKNAYFVYFKKDEKSNETKLFKMTIFPIIPSVSYTMKF